MAHSEETEFSDDEKKLIPEWSRSGDEQVVLVGIAAAIIFLGVLGWGLLRPNSDGSVAAEATTVGSESKGPATTSSDDTTEPDDFTGDVQAAVKDFPGQIDASNTAGSVAVLEGFVANTGERSEAETAALAVEGIESVDNKLELIEPAALSALKAEEVETPTVSAVGTTVTVTGMINAEEKRAATVQAVKDVPGVTEVVDQLTVKSPKNDVMPEPEPKPADEEVVEITDQLNLLPQVQFDYNSTTIRAESFSDLDKAVELLLQIDGGYDGTIEVQGYTDTTGDAAANQTLSEGRAEAVRQYLIENGVSEDLLVSKGYGPTDQFGPDLEDNRLVRFEASK